MTPTYWDPFPGSGNPRADGRVLRAFGTWHDGGTMLRWVAPEELEEENMTATKDGCAICGMCWAAHPAHRYAIGRNGELDHMFKVKDPEVDSDVLLQHG